MIKFLNAVCIGLTLLLALPQGAIASTNSSVLHHIIGKVVNVRSGPGTEYSVLNQLTQWATVFVYEHEGSGNWVAVKYFDAQSQKFQRGWIYKGLVIPI